MKANNKHNRGSIALTVVMLVFGLLMSISMAYHKMIQTEQMIQDISDEHDRAMDAAFSGINYGMSVIQNTKEVFSRGATVSFVKNNLTALTTGVDDIRINSEWINLDKRLNFVTYTDKSGTYPPYRFRLGNNSTSDCYESDATGSIVTMKCIGEYIEYNGDYSDIVASYSVGIIAKCKIERLTKTVKLLKYKKFEFVDDNSLFSDYSYD